MNTRLQAAKATLSLLIAGVLVIGLQPQLAWADNLATADLSDSITSTDGETAPENDSDEALSARIDTIFKESSSGWSNSWNDEQKALYLHDYLVTHCEIDTTEGSTADSAHDALVSGKALPAGYARAYQCLLNRANVENELVNVDTGSDEDATVNLVTIGDAPYRVDCASDECTTGKQLFMAYCGHENFLVGYPEGSAYWKGVTTAIPHVGDLWAYVVELNENKATTAAIYVHNYRTGSNQTLSQGTIPAKWTKLVDGTLTSVVFRDHFTSLVSNGKEFLASAPTGLYCISTEGKVEKVYTLTSAEQKLGMIYGLTYDASSGNTTYGLNYSRAKAMSAAHTFKFPADTVTAPLGLSLSASSTRIVKGGTANVKASIAPSWAIGSVTWSTSDPSIATVNSGTITGKGYGTATITATSENEHGTYKKTCKVVVGKSLSSAKVTIATQTYTGSALKPAPTVKIGNTTLKKGTDYTVSTTYSSNTKAGTATAKVKLTGAGNYAGTVTKTVNFKINKRSLKSATVANVTYTGKALVPAVKVGSVTYKRGTDYTVTYKNSKGKPIAAANLKAAGTYTAVVKAKGSCTGSVTKKFTIAKAANPLATAAPIKTVIADPTKGAGGGGINLASALITKKGIGKITYSLASGTATKIFPLINTQTGQVAYKKGYKKGSYYALKVKVSAAGNANYKAASKIVSLELALKW